VRFALALRGSKVMAMTTTSPVARPLIDGFGRRVSYLRISVTDRCDFRCVYCMAEDMTFLPKRDVLSFEEIEALAGAFIAPSSRAAPPRSA